MNTVIQENTETHQPSPRNMEIEAAVRALRTLLEEDEHEQRETFEYLKESLDEDRPSYRRLFPST